MGRRGNEAMNYQETSLTFSLVDSLTHPLVDSLPEERLMNQLTDQHSEDASSIELGAFETELGWIGVARSHAGLRALELPQPSREAVLSRLTVRWPEATVVEEERLGDLPAQLREYLSGQRRVFQQPLDLPQGTPFQRSVLEVTLAIPYGQTRTYAWIAAQVGRPRAARAVGRVMATNPVPIIIPCHRVVGCAGDLRGYGGGLAMKERLLAMERDGIGR